MYMMMNLIFGQAEKKRQTNVFGAKDRYIITNLCTSKWLTQHQIEVPKVIQVVLYWGSLHETSTTPHSYHKDTSTM